jgi:transposase
MLLSKMLARIDADITELAATIEEMVALFGDAADRLDEIPGIGQTAAAVVIAEVGLDMTRFPTAGHLASWAKFTPPSNNPPARKKVKAPPGTATATSPES